MPNVNGAAVEADLKLAESLGSWAVELAVSDDSNLSSAVIALPNKKSRPFSSVPHDGNRVLVDPIKLSNPLFRRALKSQLWLKPSDLSDDTRLERLASYTRLEPAEFATQFAKAAEFFAKRA
jgi:hypothetical protein